MSILVLLFLQQEQKSYKNKTLVKSLKLFFVEKSRYYHSNLSSKEVYLISTIWLIVNILSSVYVCIYLYEYIFKWFYMYNEVKYNIKQIQQEKTGY